MCKQALTDVTGAATVRGGGSARLGHSQLIKRPFEVPQTRWLITVYDNRLERAQPNTYELPKLQTLTLSWPYKFTKYTLCRLIVNLVITSFVRCKDVAYKLRSDSLSILWNYPERILKYGFLGTQHGKLFVALLISGGNISFLANKYATLRFEIGLYCSFKYSAA